MCIYFEFVDFTLSHFILRNDFQEERDHVGLESSHLLHLSFFFTLRHTEQQQEKKIQLQGGEEKIEDEEEKFNTIQGQLRLSPIMKQGLQRFPE